MKQGMKHFIIPKGNQPTNKKILSDLKKNGVKLSPISSLEDLNEIFHSLK